MSRSPSESSFCVVAGCGIHVPPPHPAVNEATVNCVGPVKVELAGVVQSTWNFQSMRLFVPYERNNSGDPPGGRFGPSMSAGRRLKLVVFLKHCCVADWPAIIFTLSKAQTSGPV